MGDVEKHSQIKHRLFGMYLSICVRHVKSNRSHDFVVVDLYANDGISYWPGGNEPWEGSAQIAAKWASRAGERSICILNEKNESLIATLEENTKDYKNVIKEIFSEDENEIYQTIIEKYVNVNAHSIFLLDPYKHSDLKFTTISSIAKHCKKDTYRGEHFIRRPELIINLPTFTILKSKTQNQKVISEFFGTNKWIKAISEAEKTGSSQPKALLNVYREQLSKFYDMDGIVPIEIRTLEYNAPIYYLIFAATHPLAKKIQGTFQDFIKKKMKDFRKEGISLKLIAEADRKNIKSLDNWS